MNTLLKWIEWEFQMGYIGKETPFLFRNLTDREIDFVYNNTLLECKLDRELTKGQKELMENTKMKTMIANGYRYFL